MCHKTELIEFLASVSKSAVIFEGNLKIFKRKSNALDISALQPCMQREADHFIIMLHCTHAYKLTKTVPQPEKARTNNNPLY